MTNELNINPKILTWSITRAGYDVPAFAEKFPKILEWLEGHKKPTVKQLEEFSKKVYLPFGYLFLSEPPQESLPNPFFRTNGNQADRISINVYDTILLLQQGRIGYKTIYRTMISAFDFCWKIRKQHDVNAIVADIRQTLQLPDKLAVNSNPGRSPNRWCSY
jgi:hypothetical protein